MSRHITRRRLLAAAGAAAATVAAPAVLRAQTATLKTTAWGGKWGEVMKAEIIPAFEKEFKCKVETDSAFPYYPKLQATPRDAPLYDVLHSNTNEQWQGDGQASFCICFKGHRQYVFASKLFHFVSSRLMLRSLEKPSGYLRRNFSTLCCRTSSRLILNSLQSVARYHMMSPISSSR